MWYNNFWWCEEFKTDKLSDESLFTSGLIIEIWHQAYYVCLTTSDPDTVAKNIKKWYENDSTLYHRTKNIQWSRPTWITTEKPEQGIVNFQPISSLHFPYLHEEVVEVFSWDQHLLYRCVCCRQLSQGSGMMILLHVCKNPALSAIPKWLTLAQRILCLDVHILHVHVLH